MVVKVWCVPLGVHGGEHDYPGQSSERRAVCKQGGGGIKEAQYHTEHA